MRMDPLEVIARFTIYSLTKTFPVKLFNQGYISTFWKSRPLHCVFVRASVENVSAAGRLASLADVEPLTVARPHVTSHYTRYGNVHSGTLSVLKPYC